MNEQRQADLLAAWLAGNEAALPEGLDQDVMETIFALRPELAPAARVSAADILASVNEGPLASPMPVNASLAEPPATPAPSNRPWIYAALGAGGATSFLAAAVALFVVVGTLQFQGSSEPANRSYDAAPEAVAAAPAATRGSGAQHDGVAVVDTGAVEKGAADKRERKAAPARSASPSKPEIAMRPRPRPAPTPTRAPAPRPVSEAYGSDDAVAFAEEFDEEEPLAEERQDRFQLDAAPAEQPIGGALEDAALIPELALADGNAPTNRPASRDFSPGSAAQAPSAPPPEAEPPPMKEESLDYASSELARGSRKERAKAAGAPSSPSDGLAKRANRGLGNTTSPAIQSAEAALANGNPTQAITLCNQALAQSSGNTAERQRLFALLGEAHTAQGNAAAAADAYQQADAIRRSR